MLGYVVKGFLVVLCVLVISLMLDADGFFDDILDKDEEGEE